ncbi:MAG: hypothetical protein RMY28_033340 [Nostoc sp. ChiSLP01]|nr:hypothetical protein [Nostoc sp. ChiSLP01]
MFFTKSASCTLVESLLVALHRRHTTPDKSNKHFLLPTPVCFLKASKVVSASSEIAIAGMLSKAPSKQPTLYSSGIAKQLSEKDPDP